MKANYNVTGAARKELAGIIGNTVGMKPVYKFMPTCAFAIDAITVSKTGEVVWDERTDDETIARVMEALVAAGFTPEDADEPAADEAVKTKASDQGGERKGVAIQMPLIDDDAVSRLKRLIESKESLIRKAVGTTDLSFSVRDGKLDFPWFKEDASPEEVRAYMDLVAALCKAAKEAKRITAKDKPVDNEKYAFRCFLLRLGFIGDEFKESRKVLLKNFTGSAAFRSGRPKKEESPCE